jgi:hypothetical protein
MLDACRNDCLSYPFVPSNDINQWHTKNGNEIYTYSRVQRQRASALCIAEDGLQLSHRLTARLAEDTQAAVVTFTSTGI